ncbi:MAG: DUF5683 domain-containing protein [Bacteroidota bacterium]
MLYKNYISKIKSSTCKRYALSFAKLDIQYSKVALTPIFLLFLTTLIAQVPDTIPATTDFLDSIPSYNTSTFPSSDTTKLYNEIDSTSILKKKKKISSPKKAAILGLAIPGAGHIYNKKYWKAPLTWAGFVGGVYAIQYNTSRHKLMKDAYCTKLEVEGIRNTKENPNPCPEVSAATERQARIFEAITGRTVTGEESANQTSPLDSAAIKRFRDSFDKNTQLSWVALIGGHLVLNGVWSYVDAHLNEFDVNEDLSLKLRPSLETIALTNTSFVGMSVVLEF